MTATDTDAETEPLVDLTGFQRDLLAAVGVNRGAKGLRIKSWMEAAYEIDEVQHGRLYPNLDTLVERGLVEKGNQDRRTNSYRLTERGRAALKAHAEWLTDGLEN